MCTGTPAVDIAASATRVQPNPGGTPFNLTWNAQNTPAASCTITGTNGYTNTVVPNTCAVAPGMANGLTIDTQTTFTMNCDGVKDSVTVNVIPKFIEF